MDAEKFGTFIQQRRKYLSLTQVDLAEKLHVTDKAISRWERGVGFPDVRLMEPLAQALKISLLELMQSEMIEEETVSRDTADAALAETLEIAKKKPQKAESHPIFWISLLLIACVMAFFIFTLSYYVQNPWLRALSLFLVTMSAFLGVNAVRYILQKKLDPESGEKPWKLGDVVSVVLSFIAAIALVLSFPLKSAVGQQACDIVRLIGFALMFGCNTYQLVKKHNEEC